MSDAMPGPDMQELVQLFLGELPERIEALEEAFGEERLDEVLRLSHQLKGGAPGYGFGDVGVAAGRVEAAVRSLHEEGCSLDEVRAALDSLIRMAEEANGTRRV